MQEKYFTHNRKYNIQRTNILIKKSTISMKYENWLLIYYGDFDNLFCWVF